MVNISTYKMETHVCTSSGLIPAREVSANGKTGTTMPYACVHSSTRLPMPKSRSAYEDIREDSGRDNDDNESLRASKFQEDWRLCTRSKKPSEHLELKKLLTSKSEKCRLASSDIAGDLKAVSRKRYMPGSSSSGCFTFGEVEYGRASGDDWEIIVEVTTTASRLTLSSMATPVFAREQGFAKGTIATLTMSGSRLR